MLFLALNTDFLRKHPELELDLVLVDRLVDIVGEGFDLAFRVGHLEDSGRVSTTLANLEMSLVASPAFLAAHGNPASIAELRSLPFVRYLSGTTSSSLQFSDKVSFVPTGSVGVDTGAALRQAALEGMGVAHLMRCTVQGDLDAGRLIPVMARHSLPSLPLQAVHALGRMTPVRVRLLTDFVAQEIRRLTQTAALSGA